MAPTAQPSDVPSSLLHAQLDCALAEDAQLAAGSDEEDELVLEADIAEAERTVKHNIRLLNYKKLKKLHASKVTSGSELSKKTKDCKQMLAAHAEMLHQVEKKSLDLAAEKKEVQRLKLAKDQKIIEIDEKTKALEQLRSRVSAERRVLAQEEKDVADAKNPLAVEKKEIAGKDDEI